jgi:hypothetical protein
MRRSLTDMPREALQSVVSKHDDKTFLIWTYMPENLFRMANLGNKILGSWYH